MIANAYAINQHGTQLAELLTEIGPEQALPSVCDQALAAPPADELALCNAMRGEFEVIRDSERFIFAAAGNGLAALWFKLGYDAEANRGLIAQDHSQHCTADALVHIQADRATALPAGASAWRWSCLGNLIGCQIAARSAPAYTDYQIRMLDFGFQLRALATLAWLHREHPGESITEALLQARPDALKSPARELLAVDDGTALEVPLYSKYPRSSWHLPLRSTQ